MNHTYRHTKSCRRWVPVAAMGLLAAAAVVLPCGTATGADMLSPDEIAKLQETAVDRQRQTKLEFQATAEPMTKTKSGKAIAQRTKLPFIVLCGLYEIKESGGKKLSQRLNGTVEIRVLDSDNKVVASANRALEKMCAS